MENRTANGRLRAQRAACKLCGFENSRIYGGIAPRGCRWFRLPVQQVALTRSRSGTHHPARFAEAASGASANLARISTLHKASGNAASCSLNAHRLEQPTVRLSGQVPSLLCEKTRLGRVKGVEFPHFRSPKRSKWTSKQPAGLPILFWHSTRSSHFTQPTRLMRMP